MAVLDAGDPDVPGNPDVPTLAAGHFGALPGITQTVPRAELFAAVHALEISEMDEITPFGDCKYFVDYSAKHHSLFRSAGNGDLWDKYIELAE